MAQTSVGFAGTVNDAEWAVISGYLGNGYCVGSNGHLLTTAVGGSRAVSVAAGIAYGDGVQTTLSSAENVALATPTNGQWYLITLRRVWATKVTSLVAIPHTTTSNTAPTAAPSTYPAAMLVQPGIQSDQPIAWAWCNSANTTLVIFDLRLQQMEFLPVSVPSALARDAKFPTPVQGNRVWREDLGVDETYYGLYQYNNGSPINPGGRDVAGWYAEPRNSGLVPIFPASVAKDAGTVTVNSLGTVAFSGGMTNLRMNGVHSSKFRRYKIVMRVIGTANADILLRMRVAGVDSTSTYYFRGSYDTMSVTAGAFRGDAGDRFYVSTVTNGGISFCDIILDSPGISTPTQGFAQNIGDSAAGIMRQACGMYHGQSTTYDGFSLLSTNGAFSGTINVYGILDN